MKPLIIIAILALAMTSTVKANAALICEDFFSNSNSSISEVAVRAFPTCDAEIAKLRASTQQSLIESSAEIAELKWIRLKENTQLETNAITTIDFRIQQLQDSQVVTFKQSRDMIRAIQDASNN